MEERKVYLGIDIGSEYLDGALGAESRRFGNDGKGHRELLRWIQEQRAAVQVICEASGGYERSLVRVLQQNGVLVSLVQASRVRQFARASGLWAKTDAIDARFSAPLGRRWPQRRRGALPWSRKSCGSWIGGGGT
jgi:transposase